MLQIAHLGMSGKCGQPAANERFQLCIKLERSQQNQDPVRYRYAHFKRRHGRSMYYPLGKKTVKPTKKFHKRQRLIPTA